MFLFDSIRMGRQENRKRSLFSLDVDCLHSWAWQSLSSQDLFNHPTVDIGQAEITSTVAVGEFLVVQTE